MNAIRLVRFSNVEGRTTPPALLLQLREIDPTAELVYVGEKQWWLGAVRSNDERRKAGEHVLAFESRRTNPNPRNVMLGKLLLQGFARIQAYHCAGDPALTVTDADGDICSIVEDFRARDKAWRVDQGKASFKERMAHSSGELKKKAADAEFRDYLRNDGRSKYRREMRDRVMFGPAGMTGGRSERRKESMSPGGIILPAEGEFA